MDISEDLGTRMLAQNERVRIWEHRVAPGETGPLHLHRHPYQSVVVRGSRGDTMDAEGGVIDHFELTPGAVFWYGPADLPETHALHNTGVEEILIITTELLTS